MRNAAKVERTEHAHPLNDLFRYVSEIRVSLRRTRKTKLLGELLRRPSLRIPSHLGAHSEPGGERLVDEWSRPASTCAVT
jgi:hypothetical protein